MVRPLPRTRHPETAVGPPSVAPRQSAPPSQPPPPSRRSVTPALLYATPAESSAPPAARRRTAHPGLALPHHLWARDSLVRCALPGERRASNHPSYLRRRHQTHGSHTPTTPLAHIPSVQAPR